MLIKALLVAAVAQVACKLLADSVAVVDGFHKLNHFLAASTAAYFIAAIAFRK